jgi:hypothetical protein
MSNVLRAVCTYWLFLIIVFGFTAENKGIASFLEKREDSVSRPALHKVTPTPFTKQLNPSHVRENLMGITVPKRKASDVLNSDSCLPPKKRRRCTLSESEASAKIAQSGRPVIEETAYLPLYLPLITPKRLLKDKAQKGDVQAQFELGEFYYNRLHHHPDSSLYSFTHKEMLIEEISNKGKNLNKAAKKAKQWFKAAALQGHAEAQCWLGFAYYFGQGTAKNAVKAAIWWEKAAAQGNRFVQEAISKDDHYGKNMPCVYVKSPQYLLEALTHEPAEKQYQLGLLCYHGKGGRYNCSDAIRWWTSAASQGHAAAQCRLGLAYIRNPHIFPDHFREGRRWLIRAAALGDQEARFWLNTLFRFKSLSKNRRLGHFVSKQRSLSTQP